MRIGLRVASLVTLILICMGLARAQSPVSAPTESVEGLRAQLQEVEAKEAELQVREKQLDEDLRPENIERSLALNGSTRPEDLREQRRQQLEAEKGRVSAQLQQLATRRERLQAAITTAETTEAYRQSIAAGATTTATTATTPTSIVPPPRGIITTTSRTTRATARRSRVRRPPRVRPHRRRSLSKRPR